MALKVTILKNTLKSAFVKISTESSGTGSLSLEELCFDKDGNKIFESFDLDTKKFDVFIKSVQWAGVLNSVTEISRNGNVVLTLTSGDSGNLDFVGENGSGDSENSFDDFKFSGNGGNMQVWMVLGKRNYRSLSSDARDE